MRFPLPISCLSGTLWLVDVWACFLSPLVGAARPHARRDGGLVQELFVEADGSLKGPEQASRRGVVSVLEIEHHSALFEKQPPVQSLASQKLQSRKRHHPGQSRLPGRLAWSSGWNQSSAPVKEIVIDVPEYIKRMFDGHQHGNSDGLHHFAPFDEAFLEVAATSPNVLRAMKVRHPEQNQVVEGQDHEGLPLQEHRRLPSRWQDSRGESSLSEQPEQEQEQKSLLATWSNPWTPESVVTMLRQFEVDNPRAQLDMEEEETDRDDDDDGDDYDDRDHEHSKDEAEGNANVAENDAQQETGQGPSGLDENNKNDNKGEVEEDDEEEIQEQRHMAASSFYEVAAQRQSHSRGPLSEEDWGEFDDGSVSPAIDDHDATASSRPSFHMATSEKPKKARRKRKARVKANDDGNKDDHSDDDMEKEDDNENNENENADAENSNENNNRENDDGDGSSSDASTATDAERFTQAAWRAFKGDTTTSMPRLVSTSTADTRLPWEKVTLRSDCLGNASLDSDLRGRSLHYRLDARGAAGINVAAMFEGREFPNCSGKVYLDQVDVVAITNETDPINGSHGLIYIPEGKVSYTVYICYKALGTEYILGQLCLAEVHVNPRPWTILSMLDNFYTQWWFPSLSKRLASLYRVNFWILSAFETFVVAILAIWLIVMTYVVFKLASARNVPEKKKPRPLKIASAEESFAKNVMQMTTFCVALVNLAGISIREMTLYANTNLIHSILFLGCTTSTMGIWRLTHHMYVDQLYDTGLVNGKFLTFPNSWHIMDMLLVLACTSMICLIVYGLLLVSSQTMNLSPLADCLSALLGLAKVFHSTWARINDRQDGICRISVFDLENSLKGHMRESDAADWDAWNSNPHDEAEANHAGGSFFSTTVPASPREDLLQIMRENDDVKLPWQAFCGACRRGEDPLAKEASIDRLKEEFEGSKRFGLLDLLWHPNYFYRRRGSRVAFGNLPAALSFVLGMVLFFVVQTLLFEVSIPELERLVSSKGEFHPNFDHERREFNLFHHKAFDTLSLLTAHMRETTRSTNLSTSMLALGNLSNHSSDVTYIPLTVRKQYPVNLHLHQQGVADRVSDYFVDIVPVRQALVSMVVEDQTGWAQCFLGPEVIYKTMSLPPWSENLTVEMFVLDYTMMVPGTREDVERARELGLATVVTVYEPYPSNYSEDDVWICTTLCKADSKKECIESAAGPHGCYLAILPVVGSNCMNLHGQGLSSAFQRSDKFLSFKKKAADFIRFCPAGYNDDYDEDDCIVSASMDPERYGYIRMFMHEIVWPSSRWSQYKIEWVMTSSLGQELTYQTNKVWFVRGISLPESVQVILPQEINTFAATQINEKWFHYNFRPYQMDTAPLTFRALIVPLMYDRDFALSPMDGQEIVNDCPDDDWTAWNLSACDADPMFAESTFCGGSIKMPAVLVEIHKWEPQLAEVQMQIAPVDKDKYSHLDAELFSVSFGTLDGEYPAGWAIQQTCLLDFREVPEQLFPTYLTFDSFEKGVSQCRSIRVSYLTNDGMMQLSIPTVLWFQMGLLMHTDDGSRVRLLKAALKSNFFSNLGSIIHACPTTLYHFVGELPSKVVVFSPAQLHYDDIRLVFFPWSALLQEDNEDEDPRFMALLCLTGKDVLSHRTLAPIVRMASERRLMELVECLDFVRPPSVTLSSSASVPVAAIQWGKTELLKKLLLKDGVRNWVVNSIYWREGYPERVGKRTLLDYVVKYGCQKCVKLIQKAIEVITPILKAVGKGKDFSHLLGGNTSPLSRLVKGFIQHLRRGHSLARVRLSQARLSENSMEPVLDTLLMLRGEIKHVELARNSFLSEELMIIGHRLAEMAELVSLDISGNVDPGVTNCENSCRQGDAEFFQQAFNWLPRLSKLRSLRIGCLAICSVGGSAVVEHLKGLPQLEVLDISNNLIGPLAAQGLADALAMMPNLTTLDVSGNMLGEGGLEALRLDRVPSLKRLRAGSNSLDVHRSLDGFMAHLGTLTNLEEFVFDHNFVSNGRFPAMAHVLSNLKELRILRLQRLGVDVGVGPHLRDLLGKLSNLVELSLGGNAFESWGLEALSVLKAPLEELDLEGWKIGEAHEDNAWHLGSIIYYQFPRLKKLDLQGNSLQGNGMRMLGSALHHLNRLQELSLGGNFFNCPDSADLAAVLNGLRNLTHLSMTHTCFGAAFFETLNHLPRLQHLDLKYMTFQMSAFRDGHRSAYEWFAHWERLRSLDISFMHSTDHELVLQILRQIRNATLLNTLAMNNVTPPFQQGWRKVVAGGARMSFPSLVLLQAGMTEEDVTSAKLSLPGVRIA